VQIGETRWSSKADALRLLMGELPSTATSQVPAYSDKQCYTALVSTLADIAKSDRYDAATSQNADSLLSKWLERSTVMSLVFYQHVFGILHLPTQILQTPGQSEYSFTCKVIFQSEIKICLLS